MVKEYHGKEPLVHLTISFEIFVFFYHNFKLLITRPLAEGCKPSSLLGALDRRACGPIHHIVQLCFIFARIYIYIVTIALHGAGKGCPYGGIEGRLDV